jgi:PAS domain S-box-containing protein
MEIFMEVQSKHPSQEKLAGSRARAPALALDHLLKLRCWTGKIRLMLRSWLQMVSMVHHRLPRPLRHRSAGYLAVLLIQIAILMIFLLGRPAPDFTFERLVPVLVVLLVALSWGVGPGLLVVLPGALLLTYLLFPPLFIWSFDSDGDGMNIISFLLVGAIFGLVASQSRRTRRRAEDMARELREEQTRTKREQLRLRTLLDVLPAPVGMVDAQGRFVERTPACKTLWGENAPVPYEIADYQGVKAWRPDSGKQLDVEEWGMARALMRGEVVTNQEVEIETFDGQRKVVIDSATPIRDETGAVLGAVGLLQDITERKRLERRTHEALQALLAMAEALVQTPDEYASPGQRAGLAVNLVAHRLAELAGNLLGCSNVSISGMDLEKGISQPLAVLGLSPEQERAWWAGDRRCARWMDGAHADVLARLQAGETLVLDMNDPLLRDEPNPYDARAILAVPMRVGERLVGLLVLDPRGKPPQYTPQEIALAEATAELGALVIEREQLLREREEAKANELALRQANQRMDAFLGMASHELKTPLTTVILGLQVSQRCFEHLLREGVIASDRAGKKLEAMCTQLNRAGFQAARLDRLVNDLLDVSRIQADKLALHLESVDLGSIICEAIQQQRQANPQRSILEYLPGNRAMQVNADAGRIEQVVTNYLTNALKYSAEEEPVEVGAALEGGTARVWVRDRGPGIPADEQEHIWERFHQAPGVEVRSGSGVGLGLGLYISQVIINRHDGQVGVASVPGEGATFWFTLPLAFPEQDAPGRIEEALQ